MSEDKNANCCADDNSGSSCCCGSDNKKKSPLMKIFFIVIIGAALSIIIYKLASKSTGNTKTEQCSSANDSTAVGKSCCEKK